MDTKGYVNVIIGVVALIVTFLGIGITVTSEIGSPMFVVGITIGIIGLILIVIADWTR